MSKLDDVYGWVHKNGYPLEMRAAYEVRKFDPLYVQHSHYEKDSETGKMREVDILASWAYVRPDLEEHGQGHVFTSLMIECKDMSHSWVMFRDDHHEFKEVPRTVLALNAIPCRLPENSDPDGWEYQIFPVDKEEEVPQYLRGVFNPCYAIKQKSINQTKAENSDPAYNAVRKIGEAVADSVGRAAAGYHRFIPAIVTTGDLFVCKLQDSGQIELEEVDRSSISLTSTRYSEPIEIHVMKEAALPSFVGEIVELAECFAAEPEYRNID